MLSMRPWVLRHPETGDVLAYADARMRLKGAVLVPFELVAKEMPELVRSATEESAMRLAVLVERQRPDQPGLQATEIRFEAKEAVV